MMNRDPLGIGKRIAQLEQGYIGVLGHQLSEELDMGRQLSAAPWTPHPRNTAAPDARIWCLQRAPVAAETWRRRDASLPDSPSSINRAKRSRSSFGNGAGMFMILP